MIAAFTRRRTPLQRLTLLMLIVVLADFSIPDGCDCGPDAYRTAAPTTIGVRP